MPQEQYYAPIHHALRRYTYKKPKNNEPPKSPFPKDNMPKDNAPNNKTCFIIVNNIKKTSGLKQEFWCPLTK